MKLLKKIWKIKKLFVSLHRTKKRRKNYELLIAYENKVGSMDKDEAIKFVDEYLNVEGINF